MCVKGSHEERRAPLLALAAWETGARRACKIAADRRARKRAKAHSDCGLQKLTMLKV